MTDKAAVLYAYRSLWHHALKAVLYSPPAKEIIRETMRYTFRTEPKQNFCPQRVKNTELFLKHAAFESGFEHHILKNLILFRRWQRAPIKKSKPCVRQLAKTRALRPNADDIL
jgi:hypothetical protein